MSSNPIIHHARTIRGNAPPVLPFSAPYALERAAPLQHTWRWMTAEVAAAPSSRCAGIPRTIRVANIAGSNYKEGMPGQHAGQGEQHRWQGCYIDNGSARSHTSSQRTSQRYFITTASHTPLAPARSRLDHFRTLALFSRQERRSYSTSEEEDYLVEEEEEKALLEAIPLDDENQIRYLMNSRFREARRLDFMISSYSGTLTENLERRLQKAASLPPLDDFPQQDAWWIKKFAQLNAIYDVRLPVELRSSQLEVNALTEQAVKRLLRLGRDSASIRKAWIIRMREDYSPEGKKNIWGEMMLWLLHHDQDAVLPALEAISGGKKAPSYAVADILEHFMSSHLQRAESDKLRLPPGFLYTLEFLLQQKKTLGRALSQKFVHLVLTHSSLEEGAQLWKMLRGTFFNPARFTSYHLAYFFGKHGEYKMAIRELRRRIELGAPPRDEVFASVCTQILRSSATKANDYPATAEILSEFTTMGVPLNIYLYTVVMHNAIDHGDLEAAFTVYRLMQQNGIEPNDYTYTVLLKGLKDGKHPEMLQSIVRDAGKALPNLERPRVVATDIIHCIYLQHFEPASTATTFADLAKIYHEHFDPSIPIALGVPPHFFGRTVATTMNPPPHAIAIVLAAYLKLVSRHSPEEVVRLYHVFQHQIERPDNPAISSLGRTDHFFNAFLFALGQNANTLQMVPTILRQMTDKRVHAVPLTSKYTWDILVNAFMRHKQPEAAERVLEIMRKYNEEPGDVTWNSLVRGYARLQEVDKALDTIRQMQLQKVELDISSLRALSRMRENDKLATGLQELGVQQRSQAEEEQDYLVPDDYQEDHLVPEDYEEQPSVLKEIEEEDREEAIREEQDAARWAGAGSASDSNGKAPAEGKQTSS